MDTEIQTFTLQLIFITSDSERKLSNRLMKSNFKENNK